MSRVRVPDGVPNGPLVKWSRRGPLTPQTGVRLSHGSPQLPLEVEEQNTVGAFNGEGPPVPIPNTEVKLTCADDTCLETDWENRSVPTPGGFCPPEFYASLAQQVEHAAVNRRVVGSNPTGGATRWPPQKAAAIFGPLAQLVRATGS